MPKTSYNVQPLQTKEELDDMKWSLRRFCSERDYYLFLFGITGLGTKRISTVIEKSKVSNNKGSNLTIAKIVYCSLSSKFHDIFD